MAGISTDSGIPDYRGEQVKRLRGPSHGFSTESDHQGTYVKNSRHRPILYHELVSSESFLQCYWARGFMGWPAMRKARPNTAHYVLSELMETDYVSHIITQNVDNLHRDASSVDHDRIIELHGSLYQVECLACGSTIDRDTFQQGLEAINPTWTSFMLEKPEINPDGDAKLPGALCYKDFNIFPCTTCSSRRMKPTVVFFGENIPKRVADAAEQAVRQSNAVLVLASSLATYSSFRLVRLAKDLGLPIGILCKGPTRADSLASWKIEMECSPVLQQIQFMLLAR